MLDIGRAILMLSIYSLLNFRNLGRAISTVAVGHFGVIKCGAYSRVALKNFGDSA